MLSPYALTRHGGVQGQVVGLSRALRALGHDVTVLCPADPGEDMPEGVGEHIVIGRPTALRSNGSVAPVALWPTAAARVERHARRGGFDVLHVHEPLAPVAAYGLVLTAPLPMVGTYHRAGVSRWVPVLKPLAELVGRRMQIRVAVSEAARETGERSGGGRFEVLFNGVDLQRFESAEPVRDAEGRPAVVFIGRLEERKGLNVLLDAFARVERPAVLWVVGDGPSGEMQRRRHPESYRVHWLGALDDRAAAARSGRGRPPVRTLAAGRVLRHGRARGLGGGMCGGRLGHRRLPGRGRRARHPGPAGRRRRAGRARWAPALADAVEGCGQSSPEARKAALEHVRAWSMDTLAERYVDLYAQAIERYRAVP